MKSFTKSGDLKQVKIHGSQGCSMNIGEFREMFKGTLIPAIIQKQL